MTLETLIDQLMTMRMIYGNLPVEIKTASSNNPSPARHVGLLAAHQQDESTSVTIVSLVITDQNQEGGIV